LSVLSVRVLTHAFGRFFALKNVDLSIASGEVVGILGENGAGKSTLLNVLSGALQPTAGTLAIDEEPLKLKNYHEANLRGIWRIFQDPALIGNLPVFENLLLGHEQHFIRAGILDKRAMIRMSRELVADMGLNVDVHDLTLRYDFATRQALEVGRATLLPKVLGLPAGFVLFDEPTTGLTRSEVMRLLERMRQLRSAGAGVAFVSHRLQEVLDVCNRLVVLKDGVVVASGPVSEFDENKLHRLMVGRDGISAVSGRASLIAGRVQRLSVEGLGKFNANSGRSRSRRAEIAGVSFTVDEGTIVGIGGLLGSGKGELLRILAGVAEADAGSVRLAHKELTGGVASRKRVGVAYVPSDRLGEAVIGTLSVAFNISLPSGDSGPSGFSTRLGLWRTALEGEVTRSMIAKLGVKAAPAQRLSALSGGNQQKVALARWMHRNPLLLLVENPTAGVDVGAKADIYRLLRELAAQGASVLYVTDDLPELIGLSDRILIMRDGRLVANIDNRASPAIEHELVATMIGSAGEGSVSTHPLAAIAS
jgi:ABC-type sugar transport system ATPase subunit